MKPRISLVRAISSEFVRRKLASLVLVFGIILGLLWLGSLWLVTVSAWWWLLVFAVLATTVWGLVMLIVVQGILRVVRPGMSTAQGKAVSAFVDKLERNLEHIGTPLIIIEFKMVRDLIWTRNNSFIKSAVKDGSTLHKDFLQLEKDFQAKNS